MRIGLAWVMIGLTFSTALPCYSQTSAEINVLLKKSKLVDTGREVNTTIGADRTTISTYCHPQATNQDCKVTALLMMKELRQHYKSIHCIQVFFFDSVDVKHFREVAIREGDIALVDEGKPLQQVLSKIDVVDHRSAPSQKMAAPQNMVGRSQMDLSNALNRKVTIRAADGGTIDWNPADSSIRVKPGQPPPMPSVDDLIRSIVK